MLTYIKQIIINRLQREKDIFLHQIIPEEEDEKFAMWSMVVFGSMLWAFVLYFLAYVNIITSPRVFILLAILGLSGLHVIYEIHNPLNYL